MPAPDGGALVLGANYRGLGMARSLGRRGVRVWVARTDDHRVASLSRYVERTLPRPESGDLGEWLIDVAERHGLDGWTLLPTDDRTAYAVAEQRERLSGRWIVGAASRDALRVACDKRETYAMAARLGIDHPRTWFPAGPEDLDELPCEFPAILKPAVRMRENAFTTDKAWPVGDRAQLRDRYEAARRLVPADEVMVQELIVGGGDTQLSFAALADRGRVVVALTARRERQFPRDFGHASTAVVTIEDGEVEARARRLLEAMECSGLVEVEFKRDARDGRIKLLDVNARVWGWHTLGARAGTDFTWLYWRQLHDDPPAPVRARAGVRWVRMATDLPIALSDVLNRRLGVREYLRSVSPRVEHAMLVRDDALPGLCDGPLLASLAARRMVQRRPAGEPVTRPTLESARLVEHG